MRISTNIFLILISNAQKFHIVSIREASIQVSLIGYRGAAEYPPSQEKVNFHFLLFFCRKLELNGKIHSKHTIIFYKWKASGMIESLSRINIHTLILQYYNCKLFDFALIKVHMWVHVKSDGSALLLLCSKTESYLFIVQRKGVVVDQASIHPKR